MLRRTLLALFVVLGCSRQDAAQTEENREAAEWAAQVEADKAGRLHIEARGEAPRKVLRPPAQWEAGTELVARVQSEDRVTIGNAEHALDRVYTLTATLHVTPKDLSGRAPVLAFEVRDLEGTIPDLQSLPTAGTVELGAYGEPWVVILEGSSSSERIGVWEMDLKQWLRDLLPPIPTEAVGVGAQWTSEWTDYWGHAKVTDRRTYELVSLSKTSARIIIERWRDGTSSVDASRSSNRASATMVLPRPGLGVPRLAWAVEGEGALAGAVEVSTKGSGTTTMRPASDPIAAP